MAANYHHYQMAVHAAAAAWREPDSPQLSFVSGCSSLFSISTLQDDDDDRAAAVVIAGHALPSTPVSLAGFAAGDDVDMEVQQASGDDRRSIRMMRNRESRAPLQGQEEGNSSEPSDEDVMDLDLDSHKEKADQRTPTLPEQKAYVENLEKEVRRLVDENLKLKKQCKELKLEVAALVLPTKSSLRRTSSTQF